MNRCTALQACVFAVPKGGWRTDHGISSRGVVCVGGALPTLHAPAMWRTEWVVQQAITIFTATLSCCAEPCDGWSGSEAGLPGCAGSPFFRTTSALGLAQIRLRLTPSSANQGTV